MTEQQLAEQIAELVIKELRGSMISSALPVEIGDWIRETCQYKQLLYMNMIPMGGGTCINVQYKLYPDGSFMMEMQDTNGRIFWTGIFHPEERT